MDCVCVCGCMVARTTERECEFKARIRTKRGERGGAAACSRAVKRQYYRIGRGTRNAGRLSRFGTTRVAV